jgi:glyoxylase-like metal-dependent hydrolase (beta-lactamase superfamily II)
MFYIQVFTFSPIQENTYVLYNEQQDALIIDPGTYFEAEREELDAFITEKGLSVKKLLLTHGHLDHVFGVKHVAEKYQVTPWVHPLENPVLAYASTSALMYNMPFDMYQGPWNELTADAEIELGSDRLTILFTPGHSPGSVSFYCAAQHFVIGGDVLFQRSIGRTDLPGGSFDVLANSIREQLFVLPDETVVFSGHGPSTTVGDEKLYNPFVGEAAR